MRDVKHRQCATSGCGRRPTFGVESGKGRFCAIHKEPGMSDVTHKRCETSGCGKRATFDVEGGKGRFCAIHKEPGMRDVRSKRCQAAGCDKLNPVFGVEGGKGRFCAIHKEPGMRNVRNKQCEASGCDKLNPTFDVEGGKGRFCAIHKEPGMRDVKNKQCEEAGCDKQPTFGIDGGKGRFCAIHKEPGMRDVRNKRCQASGCEKLNPTFDVKGGKGRFCVTHKEPGMRDVKHKRCEAAGCPTGTLYGPAGLPTTHCAQHRGAGMLRRSNARCRHANCREPAIYGPDNEPRRCEAHKHPEDHNLTERSCASCGLLYVLDANGVCEACDPTAFKRGALAKQRGVFAHLDAAGLPGTSTDRIVEGGTCGAERPDRVYELVDRVLVVEVDEDQHKGRPCLCEQTRMVNVSQAFGGLPVQWVRFNPDEYKPRHARAVQKHTRHRYATLTHVLKGLATPSATRPPYFVSVLHLYFDGWTEAGGAADWRQLLAWDE